MTWNPLTSASEIDAVIERSNQVPCLIFKHSTRCSISFMAKHRLEATWDFPAAQIEVERFDLRSGKIPVLLQAVLGHRTDAASGAVLEDEAGDLVGTLGDLSELVGGEKRVPVHAAKFRLEVFAMQPKNCDGKHHQQNILTTSCEDNP